MNKNEELMKLAYKAISDGKERVNSDYHRLKYHLMPPVGFMNDPNGFININGEYHLFYQLNPLFPKGKKVYWGHVKSIDLVNWQQLPIALSPGDWYDKDGCYSGSAVDYNGKFTLIYTGNVKNSCGNRETYQCIAQTEDNINFIKSSDNPVINNQPEGYTRHFRDPKVWKHDGVWYMVIGAQTVKEQGTAILYSSYNLFDWNLIGEVAGSNIEDLSFLGYMWECPNLLNIKGKDVLIFCPQGVEKQGDLYNNIYQCGYLVGNLDYKTGKLNYKNFMELDRGFEFYAPQFMEDDRGRKLLIGWIGLPDEDEAPTVKNGWLHCLSMVRELDMKDDRIIQKPAEEMKLLRKNEISYRNVEIKNEQVDFNNINGDSYELLCDFSWSAVSEFGIKLRCNETLSEETVIYYDVKSEKLILDRDKSGLSLKGVRKCDVKNHGNLKLHIFMDTSSIEIFVNDGEEVFTARIYPNRDSRDIIFYSKNGDVKFDVKYWEL
ncbi:sucrose-6-phosphate hydrolase [Clostridium pasteurianum DSM 525 = ATCC 6013]|uniref:Sucrose-6-phosphate hydrolase n=1 Tax=Clostridium pasteurianum DSM 525 = ATCC 6013 TaxID=1262449 RepID=A0A0H3J9X1_CLOPA|nr:sucrose-6-phosphate hydrolase [Clostridium pasteurianum]AJA49048.1 sucrose-6-phosphate hydrolase [Clostridium pasteurianum DSM 525 = ATCC 6013]AJA53036.1 sucrose-6-phosphate hydrolase [Clostridium pasteurianum DSM 525 = ATCC 6013]AOZ76252.1 sucrose-6-phosphate hydrolase [Clostridium pasteurianum DSM 525 = ATCC 6013]AOZ80048.1 sucrose-6-phosphate hydrolase [Clostridium pasteurianum]ELP58986.1 Sucrase-6-phosphate hydrolase [Clostridium pasteurianum DSM 525 = ATCC 6013]